MTFAPPNLTFLCLFLFCTVSCKDQKGAVAPALPEKVVEISEEVVVAPPLTETPAPAPSTPELKVNKNAQVAILCYHDFTTEGQQTQMRIGIAHFRKQLEAIRDSRLPVISLKDFTLWRREEKDIPDSSIMITIDDGYDSVYHLAAPLLKEFGFPYTVFLYKKYVNGGGRALTTPMIKELLLAGGEIGSHSVSHPLNIARPGNRSPEEYELFVQSELRDSKTFLEDMFMRPVPTYAHPGGSYTQRILELGPQYGYEFMFSVNPAKAKWDSLAGLVPRYVVLGNDPADRNFKAALSFRGVSEGDLGRQLIGGEGGESLVNTYPKPNATIAERSPLIAVDISKLENVDPASINLRVAGIGQLPFDFNPSTGRITAQIREILRTSEVHVHVSLTRKGADKPDMISWKFYIDLVAHYLPDPPVMAETPKAVPIMEEEEAGGQPHSPTPAPLPPPPNSGKAPRPRRVP